MYEKVILTKRKAFKTENFAFISKHQSIKSIKCPTIYIGIVIGWQKQHDFTINNINFTLVTDTHRLVGLISSINDRRIEIKI